ncbi:serine/threonine-protein kinase [Mucilaginibacter boryungensis]|uniref:Serine/threonine protein kinase n=1 Tax=Mucilaginibacter boryungensis TaxID=768480 RepID=A0ABR9XNL4_9SPHI|nr:serine/threonine-protein kinase [Mucilaginibacter boryungensis]MBE9668724.1 serine/threonine protein kinase [Mucilaginibacter boryungensis]
MNYKYVKNIGNGGFGIVDKVLGNDGKHYARKTFQVNQGPGFPLNLEANVKKRFIREAKMQSGLVHPNIVPVIEKDLDSDPPSFIMPLANSTLEEDLTKDNTLNGNYMNAILDIIAGLEELHAMSIYHRDLKPANVLGYIDPATGVTNYAITDFGLMSISVTNISAITQTGMRMKSDYYTAPEIVKDLKKASAQSDIYSLGCILHDMVATDDRIPCNEIKDSCDFGGILLACTRQDPARRFKSVTAVRDALLSLGQVSLKPKTYHGAQIFDLLAKDADDLDEHEWQSIVDFIDDNADSDDSKAVLRKLSLKQIDAIILGHPKLAAKLGIIYADWIRTESFLWDQCDGLSIRLEKFINSGKTDVKAECLMAMLYLGTSHNRFYVERKFARLINKELELDVAKRLAIELRADSEDACRAISHLKRSIDVTLSEIHPLLNETIKEICYAR